MTQTGESARLAGARASHRTGASRIALTAFAALLVIPISPARAQDDAAMPETQPETQSQPERDKSGYHLFNPTPRELMRPMAGDRPDLTESPITVDAGHLQIETGFFRYTDDEDEETERSWAVLDETNFRLGVLNDTELQLIITPYTRERVERPTGSKETLDGFGDVTLRVKQNVWGNDRGDTAFAVMPRIKIPTGTELSNGRAEGSVIGTFGWELAEGWDIGLQAEPGFAYKESDDSYLAELGHTAVLGFPLIDPWAGYVEYGGLLTSESLDAYEAVFSTGLTYEINPDAVLDVGTRIGLTDEAEDATVFTGITMRF